MPTSRPRMLSFLFGFVLVSAAGTGCGDVTALSIDSGSGGGSGPVPARHRPTAVACPMDRPAGICTSPGSATAECIADSECAAGQNGRCRQQVRFPTCICSYDSCFADTDCGAGGVCSCRGSSGPTDNSANVCLKSNCRVDADCGGRYCSPTVDFGCGAFFGVVGYYCHTAKDSCLDDTDCASQGGGDCRYNPTTAAWTCVKSICAG